MLAEIRDGFILAFRRWHVMLTLAALITLSAAVLSFALADVLSEVYVLKGAKELRERHAVFFTAYYPEGGDVSRIDDETVQYLMDLIERQQAYTSIVYNMALDNPDFAGGYPTLILFGDVVPNLFPDMHLCVPVPCAMRGAKVTGDGIDRVNIGGTDIPVEQRLSRGATFFDVNAAGLPLDYRIVIRAPTSVIPVLNPIEREELITRTVFLNPPGTMVYTFISGAARGGLFLVPHEVSIEQPQQFREIMMRSAMYIIGMVAFLALAFMAFVLSARLVMQQERRGFKIRQMYGATPLHISFRIGGFLAAVVLLPEIAFLFLLQRFLAIAGALEPNPPLWVMLLLAFIFAFLWFYLVREVLSKEGLGGW
ncbi:MAG: hypothetical protein ACOYYF_11840 [Chloroflexota bacterium]